MTNRDQYINDNLKALFKSTLPDFEVLNIFDVSMLNEQPKFPFVYVYSPSDTADSTPYNDGNNDMDDIKVSVVIYLGFKCATDFNKQGIFQEEYWRLASLIEKAFRGLKIKDYQDVNEKAIIYPPSYREKAVLNPNNKDGKGLAYLHFEFDIKVFYL